MNSINSSGFTYDKISGIIKNGFLISRHRRIKNYLSVKINNIKVFMQRLIYTKDG
jgi:hypothetical protein